MLLRVACFLFLGTVAPGWVLAQAEQPQAPQQAQQDAQQPQQGPQQAQQEPQQSQQAPQQAQQDPQQSIKPRELMVAPSAPKQMPEAILSNPGGHVKSTGVPANVCQELVAYLQQSVQKEKERAEQGKAAKSPTQTAGPGQTAPPIDTTQQQSGLSAPTPGQDRTTGQPQLTPEQAQALLNANDLRGCQSAVQKMRRAGAEIPPGLLALAALREDLLARSAPPAGTAPPAGSAPPGGTAPPAGSAPSGGTAPPGGTTPPADSAPPGSK